VSTRPWTRAWQPVAKAAAEALRRAHGSPRRGAAIEDAQNIIHCGVSIQVSDPPAASLCAEQVAVAGMCVDGSRSPRRLAVIGPPPDGAPPPCGRCLQILIEFGDRVEVRWGTPTAEHGRSTVKKLMPYAFRDYRGGEG